MELISLTAGIFIIICGLEVKMTLGTQGWLEGEELNDVNMSTIEIIQKYGYPAETHTLESEDGYILKLHRIPHGKNSNSTGFPILVQHGLFCDSSSFVISGRRSLGFLLADEGFDVWLGNFRGNVYTTSHKYLHRKDTKFWDFSWHEHGMYDLPALINYICNYTGIPDILYSGYSMGGTAFLVMTSERPEYNKKIRGAALLGPASTLKYTRTPLRIFAPFERPIQVLGNSIIHGELNVQSPEYQNFVKVLSMFPLIQRIFIKNIIFLVTGFDNRGFDEEGIPNLISHMPSITSLKTVAHYSQLITSGKFRQYDYGKFGNLRKYDRRSPPEYDLERITTPMSLFLAPNDYFASLRDALMTLGSLPSVKSIYFIPREQFTHLDFIMAKDNLDILYRNVSVTLKYLMNHGRDIIKK